MICVALGASFFVVFIARTVAEFDVMLILSFDLWQSVILSLPLRNNV